jgi:hypothetical protein
MRDWKQLIREGHFVLKNMLQVISLDCARDGFFFTPDSNFVTKESKIIFHGDIRQWMLGWIKERAQPLIY